MPGFIDIGTCLILLLATSAVELIAAGIACREAKLGNDTKCDGEVAYSVAVGAVSTAFTLLMILMGAMPSMAMTAAKLSPFMSTFLVLWWWPGAGVLTFRDPFRATGNGYYATWGSLLFALLYFSMTAVPLVKMIMAKGRAPPAAAAPEVKAEVSAV